MSQATLAPGINSVDNSNTEPSYGQLFKIFIRRFPWFLGVFISAIAIAAFVTSRTQPTYRSSMQLLVEPNYQGKREGAQTVSLSSLIFR